MEWLLYIHVLTSMRGVRSYDNWQVCECMWAWGGGGKDCILNCCSHSLRSRRELWALSIVGC